MRAHSLLWAQPCLLGEARAWGAHLHLRHTVHTFHGGKELHSLVQLLLPHGTLLTEQGLQVHLYLSKVAHSALSLAQNRMFWLLPNPVGCCSRRLPRKPEDPALSYREGKTVPKSEVMQKTRLMLVEKSS